MPVIAIAIRLGKGMPDREKAGACAVAVTSAVAEALDVCREWVTVLIEEYDRENWATGGELHATNSVRATVRPAASDPLMPFV